MASHGSLQLQGLFNGRHEMALLDGGERPEKNHQAPRRRASRDFHVTIYDAAESHLVLAPATLSQVERFSVSTKPSSSAPSQVSQKTLQIV
jgi:ribosomal protein S30